jgi:predicted dehydrogenase
MKKLRFAVLGTGFWSQFQIHAWFEVGGVDLVALYNRTRSKAEKMAERFNVASVFDDAEQLFRNEQLDFVDIVTEVPAHAELVNLAVKYRVPVICQKPMASDLETCERMVSNCEQAGIPFLIHENFRWQHPIRKVKQLLDEGHIGKPFRARFQWTTALPPFAFENQPFTKSLEHLILTDLGSHQLDLARFFFGEPLSLYCQHLHTRTDVVGEDVASVMLRFEDVICNCEMSFSTLTELGRYPETLIFIEGASGSLELAPDYWIRLTNAQGTLARRYPPEVYSWADPKYTVVHASIVPCNADLLRALTSGQPGETSAQDNIKTMRLVFAAYESAAQNQVISLAQESG